jgi:hypothetical protein
MPPKKIKLDNSIAASSNKFKTTNPEFKWNWSNTESLIYGDCGVEDNDRIMGFDLVREQNNLHKFCSFLFFF